MSASPEPVAKVQEALAVHSILRASLKHPDGPRCGACDWRYDSPSDWDRHRAQAAADAAAGPIAAQALREAAEAWGRNSPVVRWLNERADRIEGVRA